MLASILEIAPAGVTLMPIVGESFIRSARSRVSIFIIQFPMCAGTHDGWRGGSGEGAKIFFDVA